MVFSQNCRDAKTEVCVMKHIFCFAFFMLDKDNRKQEKTEKGQLQKMPRKRKCFGGWGLFPCFPGKLIKRLNLLNFWGGRRGSDVGGKSWSKNRTRENRTGELRPSTRGPFRGHLRGMFRGESLKG